MQTGTDLVISHSWPLWSIIVLIATILGGLATFVANVLKSAESAQNLKRKTAKSPSTEPKPRPDLNDVGIEPFKRSRICLRDAAVGGLAAGGAMGVAEVLLQDHPTYDGETHADMQHDGSDVAAPLSDSSDIHETVADYADDANSSTDLLDLLG